MPSPPSGQPSLLDQDRGPEQGPRLLVTRLEVELDEDRARYLIALLRPRFPDVADAIRAAIEDLPPF